VGRQGCNNWTGIIQIQKMEEGMTQENVLNLLPESAIESGACPPGRYLVSTAKFVDDFNYGGQYDAQTALKFSLTDPEGGTHEMVWTVGPRTKLWPTRDGTGLTGGGYTTSCNFYFGIRESINAGLPSTRLAGETNISTAFEGLWAEWQETTCTGRSRNAEGKMPTILTPFKFLNLDGQSMPAPAEVSQPTAGTTPAPPVQTAAPAPTAPAPQSMVVAPPQAMTLEGEVFPGILVCVRSMLQDPNTKSNRAQLGAEIFQNLKSLDGTDASMDEKAAAMNASWTPEFVAYLQAGGITLVGEDFSS